MTKVVSDERARQARPGRRVLYVLAGSLLLAGIYLASMVGWSGFSPAPSATQTETPAPKEAPAPAPSR